MAEFDDIYNFESAVESAFKTFFTEQEIAAYTVNDSAEIEKARPRVEIMYQHGGETGHNSTASTYYRPDAFTGSLTVAVVSNLKDDETGISEHAQFRARVRNAMAKARTRLYSDSQGDDTLLPLHTVMDLVESGTAPAYSPDDGYFVSRISYEMKINVRPSVWPAE